MDRLSQCAQFFFEELLHALRLGLLRDSDVWVHLGENVASQKPGRTTDDQSTICDLTGVGIQDTAIAALAWERVQAKGLASAARPAVMGDI